MSICVHYWKAFYATIYPPWHMLKGINHTKITSCCRVYINMKLQRVLSLFQLVFKPSRRFFHHENMQNLCIKFHTPNNLINMHLRIKSAGLSVERQWKSCCCNWLWGNRNRSQKKCTKLCLIWICLCMQILSVKATHECLINIHSYYIFKIINTRHERLARCKLNLLS